MNLKDLFATYPMKHHAYAVESPVPLAGMITQMLPTDAYSYIFDKSYEVFKINDAREIKQLQAQKTEKASLFILDIGMINHEAQNTLLKIIEEPTADTFFILVIPSKTKLLPTLQSRLEFISYTPESIHSELIDVDIFFNKDLNTCFEYIKQITDDKSEYKIIKSDVIYFCNACEVFCKQHNYSDPEIFNTLFKAREYIESNGASMKMILDLIALTIALSR